MKIQVLLENCDHVTPKKIVEIIVRNARNNLIEFWVVFTRFLYIYEEDDTQLFVNPTIICSTRECV